jgi:hypothetical protein
MHVIVVRVPVRIAGGLVVAAVAGFLLGACGGGGDGSSLGPVSGATATGVQPTLPTRTRTLAAPATTAEAETTTVEVTTTAPAPPTTTRPPLTVTLVPTDTAATTPTTTSAADTTPLDTLTTETTSTSNDTPWGWIALVLVLAGVAALVIGLWSRRRSRASSWDAHLGDLSRRSLVTLDDVVERGSVVAGQVEALAMEARTLERHAPNERASAAAAQVRSGLEELAEHLEADRTLRLASPPPSAEQLAYSTALIRQQAEQLKGILRTPPPN